MKMPLSRTCSTIIMILLVASSLALATIPAPLSAQDMQLKWHLMTTPGSLPDKNDIVSPSEVNCIAIGSDGSTFYSVDIPWANTAGEKAIYKSTDGGISWSDSIGKYLFSSMSVAEQAKFRVWNIAVAPDDVNFLAVVTNSSSSNLPCNVWISRDGGNTWFNTLYPYDGSPISALSVSPAIEKNRDVAAGTRTGAGGGNIRTLTTGGFSSWSIPSLPMPGDVMSLKFSPNYTGDNTLVAVFSDTAGTYMTAGIRDIAANETDWMAIYKNGRAEITTKGAGSSPVASLIISADVELPSGYNSQIVFTRRYFISIDSPAGSAGIYRLDDSTCYQLMTSSSSRRISSIAYSGNLTSGKLLAGEVLGNTCSASVMTWFTDAPFNCSIPCWYPSIKPPTGGAGTANCSGPSYGNAAVFWSPDGSIAYAGTASTGNLSGGINWMNAYLVGEILDESAFSKSNNNGQTWAQLSLIDTCINALDDIAPTPDCSKIYLASINTNPGCSGFDSVWVSKSTPLGYAWERVLCALTTSDSCTTPQSDIAILRLAGDKPNGEVLVWSAPGTRLVKWSADYGDSWNNVYPIFPVQDIAFEDSKTLFILNPDGGVQRFGSGGAGWVSQKIISSGIDPAYSIATAYTGMTPDNDEGTVLVGSAGSGMSDVAYSEDNGNNFKQINRLLPVRDNTMVAASSSFSGNGGDGYILAINSGGMFAYSIYTTGSNPWEEWWGGAAYPDPVTGMAISRNYSEYFCTAATWGSATPYIRWSSAYAGLDPAVSLGTANLPTTRFRTCGGLLLEQSTITYAIDQRPFNPPAGGVWYYIDDLLWSGPTPISPVNHFTVSCDPVTGRAGQVDLKWRPRSLSKGYDIYIAKDIDFYMTVAKIGDDYSGPYYTPPDLEHPALWIPPGGGSIVDYNGDNWTVPALEAGHSYYWKVMVQSVATGDAIKSPWSWRESYDVRPGFKVVSPYAGIQLLSPANGCMSCSDKPAFSWSPHQEADGYHFVLAKDAAMKQVIAQGTTSTTAYGYENPLAGDSVYFWRVQAIDKDQKPLGDWSAISRFKTESIPLSIFTLQWDAHLWRWLAIGIGIILIIAAIILAFIFRNSRLQ